MRALPSRIIEAIVPARLGRSFRWLLSASVANNIGDGVAITAGPLLVASQTRDPFLVSLALFMEYLPALLFGVIGGVAADRFDRRRMVILVNIGRAVVLAVLVATIATGSVNIAHVLATLFILGTAETFADWHAPLPCPDHDPSDRAGDVRRLQCPRIRLGHDLDGRSPAFRARRGLRPGDRDLSSGDHGRTVVGTPIGGLLARTFGITGPFWFGFAGSLLLVLLLWREFAHIAHDEASPAV